MDLQPTHEVINVLRSVSTLHGQTQLLGILLRREGPDFEVDGHPGESAVIQGRKGDLMLASVVCHSTTHVSLHINTSGEQHLFLMTGISVIGICVHIVSCSTFYFHSTK